VVASYTLAVAAVGPTVQTPVMIESSVAKSVSWATIATLCADPPLPC